MFAKLKLFLPKSICLLCGIECACINSLCHACLQDLPYLENPCIIYQNKLSIVNTRWAVFAYQPPINRFILELKIGKQLIYAHLLASLMIKKLQEAFEQNYLKKPDYLIPVPLHPHRMRRRGFNQVLELARPIAKKFHIPILKNHIIRVQNTPSQMQLNAEERRKNLHQAFKLNKKITAKHVVILDDVVTTGSTSLEIVKLLRKETKIHTIDVWAYAKTISKL